VSGTEYVEANSPIKLMCNATGRPEPPHNVNWYKDGEPVLSDAPGGIIVSKKIETRVLVSMLVVKNSRPADSGTYVCRSSTGETGEFVVRVLSGAHSLANCDSCPNPAKSEAIEYLQVGPTEIRYSIAWTIFVYL